MLLLQVKTKKAKCRAIKTKHQVPVKFFLAVQTDPKAHPGGPGLSGPERAADHQPPSNAGFRMG
jgi:hypothetical protein